MSLFPQKAEGQKKQHVRVEHARTLADAREAAARAAGWMEDVRYFAELDGHEEHAVVEALSAIGAVNRFLQKSAKPKAARGKEPK